jgi:hypothetical protein
MQPSQDLANWARRAGTRWRKEEGQIQDSVKACQKGRLDGWGVGRLSQQTTHGNLPASDSAALSSSLCLPWVRQGGTSSGSGDTEGVARERQPNPQRRGVAEKELCGRTLGPVSLGGKSLGLLDGGAVFATL